MRKKLWGGVAWLGLLVLAASCGQSPEVARKELGQMKVEYNEASFVDRAGMGDALAVKLFLQAGMNVNAKNPAGSTALLAAAKAGHTEVVRLLLEKRADVNDSCKGVTPIMAASWAGKTEVVNLLESRGAKLRFTVSPEGVISDSLLNVEWYVGPNRDTTWDQAQMWASSLQVAGGGWRLPDRRELASLYLRDLGERNMDPVFKTSGWWVWTGEAGDNFSACYFPFDSGRGSCYSSRNTSGTRAFAVRSRR